MGVWAINTGGRDQGPGRPRWLRSVPCAGAAAVEVGRLSRPDPDTVRLPHGPYTAPSLRQGDPASCPLRDATVDVTS